MVQSSQPHPFDNKIMFCDVIGYSKLDPVRQGEVQAGLNRAVGEIIRQLETPLDEHLIALPTGDGMVLNFLGADPDVHLRAALILLETLAKDAGDAAVGLRIGLNTDVDSWLIDINGKRNVVGRGINMAQRVMDLGGHAQVLMHDKLRPVLGNYARYSDKVVTIGAFTVKHGEQIDIAQFVDPELAYVSSDLVELRPAPAAPLNLADILAARSRGGILSIELDRGAKGSLSMVEAYVDDYLDTLEPLQSFRIAASWIVRELLDNAFTHGTIVDGERVQLRLDRTASGLLIVVEQPDIPGFDLHQWLAAPAEEPSFLRLLYDAGLRWEQPRNHGRMQVSIELPTSYCTPIRPIEPIESVDAATIGETIDITIGNSRIDEGNWEMFLESLTAPARRAAATGRSLTVDMSTVEYMSSRGLRAMTLAKREAGSSEIIFTGVDERLAEIFAISRYDKIFKIVRRV